MEEFPTKKIKWHPKTNRLCEIPTEGLQYAFVSKKGEQLHQLVLCKDFLQDVVFAFVNNQPIKIYGFNFNPAKSPTVDLEKTRLLITNFKDKEFKTKLHNNVLDLMRHVEKRLKMPPCKIYQCSSVPPTYRHAGVWLIEAHKRWQSAPPMLSLFSLLLRIGFVHTIGDPLEETIKKLAERKTQPYFQIASDDSDNATAITAKKGISQILKWGDRKIFPADVGLNYWQGDKNERGVPKVTTSTMHDACGIASFSLGYTKTYYPHWHRNIEQLTKDERHENIW